MATKPKSTPPGISKLPIWSEANLMLFALLTGCHNYHPNLDWRSQSAMMSFWQILLWFNNSLWMSGCLLANCLVWVPSTLGWSQRGYFTRLISQSCEMRSESTSPPAPAMAILISNGVGERSLGMVTVFCHSDQAKVQPSVILLILVQQDTPELALVVMKIFTGSPYFPRSPVASPTLT